VSPRKPKTTAQPQPASNRPKSLARYAGAPGDSLPHPAFNFAKLDKAYEGAWGWHLLADPRELLELLFHWSGSSWMELRQQRVDGRFRHHAQPVTSLCKDAQDRLAHLQLDDQPEMFRFRHGNTGRFWGFVLEGVFYPVWWDPNHKVYPTEP
jgi:hypothetical protein